MKSVAKPITHNYTRRGIKIGAQVQFVCIFLHICLISAENLIFF